jgi:membrane protease YdiL (CAAX protease family)
MTGEVPMEETKAGRPPRTWDFFLTIFLIFLLLVLAVIFVLLGFGLGISTLTCADSAQACNYTFISVGGLIAVIGVPGVAIAGIVLSIVWIARRKLSFIMPLAACILVILVYLLGSYIVDLAVPGN